MGAREEGGFIRSETLPVNARLFLLLPSSLKPSVGAGGCLLRVTSLGKSTKPKHREVVGTVGASAGWFMPLLSLTETVSSCWWGIHTCPSSIGKRLGSGRRSPPVTTSSQKLEFMASGAINPGKREP